jgi:hypothetical protein
MIEHFDYLVNATQEELATLIANLDSTREEDAASEAHHEDADTIEMSAPEPGSIIKGYLEMQAREVKKDISGWYRRNKSCWLRPRDPFFAAIIKAKDFYVPDLFVWLPRGFGVDISCPNCNAVYGNGNIEVKGYPPPRRIVALDRCYYLLTSQHQCNRCKCNYYIRFILYLGRFSFSVILATFYASQNDVVTKMPAYWRLQFPCFLTHRSGLDLKVLDLMRSVFVKGICAESFAKSLKELHTKRYHYAELSYYFALQTWKICWKFSYHKSSGSFSPV